MKICCFLLMFLTTGCGLMQELEVAKRGGHFVTFGRTNSIGFSGTKCDDTALKELLPTLQEMHVSDLRFWGCSITSSSIETLLKLETLEELTFWDSKIELGELVKLNALPRLRELHIDVTKTNYSAAQLLKEKMPNVTIRSE